MSCVEGDLILDKQRVQEIIRLAHQMVYRYMSLNIPCSKLLFYAPVYFIDQLHFYLIDDEIEGIARNDEHLTLWGVDLQLGYENTLILFCPSHIPSNQSPVIELSRFGRNNMAVVSRH
ncbi:hypothetical protein GCM10027037_32780 [Mucilaginibacter koreensis]